MESREELKPCPFVEPGDELEHGISVDEVSPEQYAVICMCGAMGPIGVTRDIAPNQ